MYQKLKSITQKLRLPAPCALCNHYHKTNSAVCSLCTMLLVRIENGCCLCRLPLPANQFGYCGHCIKKRPVFDNVFCTYIFEGLLRPLLHEFKYNEGLYLRTFMVERMLDSKPAYPYKPDCLVPVPLHPKRLRQRGFNQAAELTKLLAKRLEAAYDLILCEKIINTVPQAMLNGKQRRDNLRKAFSAKPHAYQHIALVDDLLTTGSTVNELAKVLKATGAQRVDVWCLARTPEETSHKFTSNSR